MTRKALAVAILMAATIGTAAADEHPTWYAGFAVGQSTVEVVVSQPSIPPQNQTIDESDDLTKVFIGYKPVKYFAIEGSIMGSGEFSSQVGPSGSGFDVAADYFGGDLSILGIIPVADRRLDIYGRVGVQREEFNVVVRDQLLPITNTTVDQSKQISRMLGLGVQVNFGDRKRYGVRLEGSVIDAKGQVEDISEVLVGFVCGWGGSK